MTPSLPSPERVAHPTSTTDGGVQYAWTLTDKGQTDRVVLLTGPRNALPIVFVPGIMGSNLCAIEDQTKVWRLDTTHLPFAGDQPLELAMDKFFEGAGARQRLLHPARTKVDAGGDVPKRLVGSIHNTRHYTDRGWGEIGNGSYHAFLLSLEEQLNNSDKVKSGAALETQMTALMALCSRKEFACWPRKDLVLSAPADTLNLHGWFLPVYACGYNWLDDNAVAARRLGERIETIIAANNNANFRCEQVIVVTHSMGGLVARACQQLDGMAGKMAGVVHGVMPTNGAAVAYRRCKVGMRDEDRMASVVIGRTGQEVTAVFAQAPGALQLLPTSRYARRDGKGWLEVRGPAGTEMEKILPELDPYEEIYRRRDRWWALIKEEWLSPKKGKPITWEKYLKFLDKAEDFHRQLTAEDYHSNTYAFYGNDNDYDPTKDKTSFERIVWQMRVPSNLSDEAVPTPDAVYDMTPQKADIDGVNPEHVGRKTIYETNPHTSQRTRQEVSQWELVANRQDGQGDGTVPASSGRAPADCAQVRQVFSLSGLAHEGVFRDSKVALDVTLYAISKIALEARVPASTLAPAEVKA